MKNKEKQFAAEGKALADKIYNENKIEFDPDKTDHRIQSGLRAYDGLSRAMATIEATARTNTATITESEFERFLLPMVLAVSNNQEGADLQVWKDMAGSLDRPICVLDPSGEELFTLPPLMGSVATIAGTSARHRISGLIDEVINVSANLPAAGDRIILTDVRSRLSASNIGMSEEFIQVWAEVMRRYGVADTSSDTKVDEDEQDDGFGGEDEVL